MDEVTVISPFSGAETTVKWGLVAGSVVWICPTTGALFFDRMKIKASSYQNYYPYLAGFNAERAHYELEVRRRRLNGQFSWIERNSVGDRKHIDIGAGPGYCCDIASERGWDSYGVEVSVEARRFGEKHYSVRYVELNELKSGTINLITAHHVLEHISDVMAFLAKVKGILVPGGLLVIYVPNIQPLSFFLKDVIKLRLGQEVERHCDMYSDEHISGFNRRSLEKVLTFNGFETVQIFDSAQFSMHSDPWFLKDAIMSRRWLFIAKRLISACLNTVGSAWGQGNWVIGMFRNI